MKISKATIISVIIGITTLIIACSSAIKVRVVNMPPNFQKTMPNTKNVAIIFRNSKIRLSDPTWEPTLQAEMENSVRNFGYFNIVDLKTRAARIKEISRSQTGLTNEEIQIGKELKLDAYMFLQVANRSRSKCKTSYKTKKVYPCGSRLKCQPKNVKITVKDLQFTIYLRGELINVASGQSLAHTNTSPVSIKVEGEGIKSCLSTQAAFAKAARVSAANLARRLSPLVTHLQAKIDDDPVGSPDAVEDQVKEQLKLGVKWAKNGDLGEAKKAWQRALSISQNNSLYANWNLAIANWAEGQMPEAQSFFDRAKSMGGPDFMDGSKMKTFARFKKEQQRLALEKAN